MNEKTAQLNIIKQKIQRMRLIAEQNSINFDAMHAEVSRLIAEELSAINPVYYGGCPHLEGNRDREGILIWTEIVIDYISGLITFSLISEEEKKRDK